MSAAPSHPARSPPGRPVTIPVHRRSHRAAGSSRVQVVVLAAARLRALHLDPLVTGSGLSPADQPRRKKNGSHLRPAPVFIESDVNVADSSGGRNTSIWR
jgi:hypothetical protein